MKPAKALTASSIAIIKRHYDQHADGYLVLGAMPGQRLKKYVVGWHARRDEALTDCRFFTDISSAQRHFRKERTHADDVDHPSLKKDWQKQALYAWEDKFIMPLGRAIDEKQARDLIRCIAQDYETSIPRLVWKKHSGHSEYDDQDDAIYFGARDNITLLHEIAHAVHAEKTDRPDAPDHGPGFVRCVMELYNRYAGIGLDYMIVSAHQRGLLGDLETNQALEPGIAFPEQGRKNDGKKLRRS